MLLSDENKISDLQIYVQIPSSEIVNGIFHLSQSAKIIAKWAETNGLSLNTNKTQAIVFGSTHTIKLFKNLNIPSIEVSSCGDNIPFVDEVTSLGVILDSTLSWKPRVLQVTKKFNRVLYCLKTIRPCTSQPLRKRLIEALAIPHLDYCNVIYSDISKELVAQLQRLANSCIRYIYGIGRYEHITLYRRKLHWMTNLARADYFACLLMYRLVRMKEPPFLLSLFKPYQSDKPTRGPRIDLDPITVTTDWGSIHSKLNMQIFGIKFLPVYGIYLHIHDLRRQ